MHLGAQPYRLPVMTGVGKKCDLGNGIAKEGLIERRKVKTIFTDPGEAIERIGCEAGIACCIDQIRIHLEGGGTEVLQ
jgi:hypothetical protein